MIDIEITNKSFNCNYLGNISLLDKKKVSIVGTRNPNIYSQTITNLISSKLSQNNICIVSGGAIGVDAIAHKAANSINTIAVLPCGINHFYPAINKNMLTDIAKNGLVISQFENNFKATNWSFVARNELVVGLGDILIVTGADLKSGSMTSVEFALKQQKEIFVPLHRIGESEGTNYLLKENLAKPIYNIDEFISNFYGTSSKINFIEDEFLLFCLTNPNYEDIFRFDSSKLFEYELLGKIRIENGKVIVL